MTKWRKTSATNANAKPTTLETNVNVKSKMTTSVRRVELRRQSVKMDKSSASAKKISSEPSVNATNLEKIADRMEQQAAAEEKSLATARAAGPTQMKIEQTVTAQQTWTNVRIQQTLPEKSATEKESAGAMRANAMTDTTASSVRKSQAKP